MRFLEITLQSPLSAKDLSNITDALDTLYDAEFAAEYGRFPDASERLYISIESGSTIMKAFAKSDSAINSLVIWIQSIIDKRFKKKLKLETEKLEAETDILKKTAKNLEDFSEENQRLDTELKKLKIWDYKIGIIYKASITSEKIAHFDPEAGRIFFRKIVGSVLTIADVDERGQFNSYRFGLLE